MYYRRGFHLIQYIEIIRKCIIEEVFILYNILRSLENVSSKKFTSHTIDEVYILYNILRPLERHRRILMSYDIHVLK